MDLYRLKLLIRGEVQGVGFRFYTKKEADILGIKGWVKNRGDGSVEVEGIGGKGILEQFLLKVKVGSEISMVRKVDIKWEEVEGGVKWEGFSIHV